MSTEPICLNCGMALIQKHCKVRCPRCGYFEDCSDGTSDHPNVTKLGTPYMPKKVTIYMTTYCPHCRRAKDLLKRKNVAFEEVDLTEDSPKREKLEEQTGWMTVPMIFIGKEFIGGADDLERLERDGQLDAKLR